eukprot:gene4540-9007_t
MTDFLSNTESIEIRAMIEEVLNQLQHLQRSQHEISQALQEDPRDTDFLEAYMENENVIKRKIEKIEELEDFLEKVDPAFREERKAIRQGLANSPINEVIVVSVDNNSISEVTQPPVHSQPQTIVIPVIQENQTGNDIHSENGIYL